MEAAALSFHVHPAIDGVAEADWNACFPGDPENWSYYAAVEASRLEAFEWVYFEVREGGRSLAVAPAFITHYRLDTTVQGRWKHWLRSMPAWATSLLTLRLLCLGSPLADTCHFGFAPMQPADRCRDLAGRLLAGVERYAAARGLWLLAAKDLPDELANGAAGAALDEASYARERSLPNAMLELPAGGEAAWLAALSRSTRREVRRKLGSSSALKIEERHGPAALEFIPEIFRLYELQRAGSRVDFDQFEALTPDYFRHVLLALGERSVVFLYWNDGRLIGFNLCYHTASAFIDKFIGFDPGPARQLNLYVVSWVHNLRYCAARNIRLLQTGQTAYAMKVHLGSRLARNWNYFRHRCKPVNALLRLAGPLLAAERYDEDLRTEDPRAGARGVERPANSERTPA